MFPARSSGRGATSIYSLLNHNRTAMGKRMLRSWLKQPLTDVAAIQERHAVVQAFVEDDEMRCDLWDAPPLGWASAAGPLVQLCTSAGLMRQPGYDYALAYEIPLLTGQLQAVAGVSGVGYGSLRREGVAIP